MCVYSRVLEDSQIPVTGVTGTCELLMWVLLHGGPLQEQYALSPTESLPQLPRITAKDEAKTEFKPRLSGGKIKGSKGDQLALKSVLFYLRPKC